MPVIKFSYADVKNAVRNKLILKKFIPLIFFGENKILSKITFIFCSDEYLLSLNRQYLNHDYYTDILTFDLSIDEKTISEIYISIERVLENSQKHHVSFDKEITRVIFHGILHLCGYGDMTRLEKKRMTDKENEYLNSYSTFHVKL